MNVRSPGRSLLLATTLCVLLFGSTPIASMAQTTPAAKRYTPTDEENTRIKAAADRLRAAMARLPHSISRDLFADVAVYQKAVDWVVRTGDFFDARDVATTLSVVEEGLRRAHDLEGGAHPWTDARGSVARGYVSRVDGSIQPYAVIVPEGLDLSRQIRSRLDVILHGRNATLSEVRFLMSLGGKPTPKNSDAQGKISLHVFGRTNNAYRWAGETDVFEAIDAVKRGYPIDEKRIVLRGFSMGGAGAWHLGLHYPALWSSVEAGAGFTETRNYARLKDTPDYQEQGLSIYDAVDYALNVWNVPIVGYGGEQDPQLQASTNIVDALKTLGFSLKTDGLLTRGEKIDFLRVVGSKMGHKVDPPSAEILKAWHDKHAENGANLDPKRIRFTTYTVKYGKAAWLSIEAMNQHYKRAEVDAEIQGLKVVVSKVENVSMLAIDRRAGQSVLLGGEEFPLQPAVKGLLPNVYFQATPGGGWQLMDHDESRAFEENRQRGKVRGVQGPIDDAFTGPFLCVKGTSQPWNRAGESWASSQLPRFAKDWETYLRGELPVKSDSEITREDLENHHLILFGDPGSNRVLAQVLEQLPITWTRAEFTLGGETYTASDHVPVLIAPNPLNPRRYIVINSGHTFSVREFQGSNALLFPRLGDYAVVQTDGRNATVKASGCFNERWSLRKP